MYKRQLCCCASEIGKILYLIKVHSLGLDYSWPHLVVPYTVNIKSTHPPLPIYDTLVTGMAVTAMGRSIFQWGGARMNICGAGRVGWVGQGEGEKSAGRGVKKIFTISTQS